MAETRYHMQKNDYLVESDSLDMLKWYRSSLFKGMFYRARIKNVLQMEPSKLKTNRIYNRVGEQVWP